MHVINILYKNTTKKLYKNMTDCINTVCTAEADTNQCVPDMWHPSNPLVLHTTSYKGHGKKGLIDLTLN